MASANHDANHVRLSRIIDDPVTSAASDGNEITSLIRNDYLNKANRFIQFALLGMGEGYGRRNFYVERFIPGLKKASSTITWASSGVTLSSIASDYQYWLEVYDTTTVGMHSWHPSKAELDGNLNSNVSNAFTILAGSIYGYRSGTIISSGATGTLYYIQNDQRASAADSADISIDSMWFDAVVDIAASFYYEDKGEPSANHLTRFSMVLNMIRGK